VAVGRVNDRGVETDGDNWNYSLFTNQLKIGTNRRKQHGRNRQFSPKYYNGNSIRK